LAVFAFSPAAMCAALKAVSASRSKGWRKVATTLPFRARICSVVLGVAGTARRLWQEAFSEVSGMGIRELGARIPARPRCTMFRCAVRWLQAQGAKMRAANLNNPVRWLHASRRLRGRGWILPTFAAEQRRRAQTCTAPSLAV
jgi:hypothetical protein